MPDSAERLRRELRGHVEQQRQLRHLRDGVRRREGGVGGSCIPSVLLGPPPARCAGGGPPIVIDNGTSRTCGDALARVSFTFGLCSCGDIGVPALSSRTLVDAYDSALGPYAPGGVGGGVGANGAVSMTSMFEVSGDLRTAAGSGLRVRDVTNVGQQLHVGGDLRLDANLDVTDDAYVGGAITGSSTATIGGTLHVPACGAVPSNVDSASCAAGSVGVPPPCACDAADRVNVAGVVAHYAIAANNDDAAIGLDPAVFASAGAPARLDLPCGYYYLDRIAPSGALTIAVHGRTALIVGGNVEAGSSITFTLDPGATLDVFVGGTVSASALLTVGSPAYPAQSRMYVGGVCGGEGASCGGDGDCCSLACRGDGTCGPRDRPRVVGLPDQREPAGRPLLRSGGRVRQHLGPRDVRLDLRRHVPQHGADRDRLRPRRGGSGRRLSSRRAASRSRRRRARRRPSATRLPQVSRLRQPGVRRRLLRQLRHGHGLLRAPLLRRRQLPTHPVGRATPQRWRRDLRSPYRAVGELRRNAPNVGALLRAGAPRARIAGRRRATMEPLP